MIRISNKDQSYIRVDCEESIAWELRDAFSFRPPGFQFVPSYKQKLWDGWLRLYDTNKRQLYRGLAPNVMEWALKKGYQSLSVKHLKSTKPLNDLPFHSQQQQIPTN